MSSRLSSDDDMPIVSGPRGARDEESPPWYRVYPEVEQPMNTDEEPELDSDAKAQFLRDLDARNKARARGKTAMPQPPQPPFPPRWLWVETRVTALLAELSRLQEEANGSDFRRGIDMRWDLADELVDCLWELRKMDPDG